MSSTVKTFIHKVSAQVFVQVLLALRAFVILTIVTKTLGSYYFGIWSQISIVIVQLVPVFTLRFDVVFVRYFASVKDKLILRKAFSSMLFLILILLVLTTLTIFVFSAPLTIAVFKYPNLNNFLYVLLGLLVIRTLFLFAQSYYRARFQIGRYSMIQSVMILGDIFVLFFAIVVFQQTLYQALLFLIVFDFVLMFLTLLSVLKRIGVSLPDLSYLKPYLLYGLPLIPNIGLIWVVNFSDRFFITRFFGLEEVGIFAASFSLGQILLLFMAPVGFVLYPKISKLWEEKKKDEISFWMENSLKYFLFFAIPAIFGVSYFAPFALLKIATEEFVRYRWLVPILASGFLFYGMCQFYTYLVHMFEKTVWILYVFLFIAAVKIGLNILLIPRIGIMGAAMATFVVYLIQFSLIYTLTVRRFKLTFSKSYVLKTCFSACVMGGVLLLFTPDMLLKNILLVLMGIVIYLVCMVVLKAVGKKEFQMIRDSARSFSFDVK